MTLNKEEYSFKIQYKDVIYVKLNAGEVAGQFTGTRLNIFGNNLLRVFSGKRKEEETLKQGGRIVSNAKFMYSIFVLC